MKLPGQGCEFYCDQLHYPIIFFFWIVKHSHALLVWFIKSYMLDLSNLSWCFGFWMWRACSVLFLLSVVMCGACPVTVRLGRCFVSIWYTKLCSETLVTNMHHVSEFIPGFCTYDMDTEHFANLNLSLAVVKFCFCGFMVWVKTFMFSVFTATLI